MKHEVWMRAALCEAARARVTGDVPVGAVVVSDNRIIGRGCNTRERDGNPLGHAELLALGDAARSLDSWRLTGCILYCTLEPCPMCAGVIRQTRIPQVVYGAFDPVAGAAGSVIDVLRTPRLGPPPHVLTGILGEECREILEEFFRELRSAS